MYLLRPATEDDHEPLRRIHHVAFHDVVTQTWGWDEQLQDQMWDEYLIEADSLQVIEVDGEIAGYLDVRSHPDHVFIANIALDSPVQGKGIGTSILQALIEDSHTRNLPLRLEVIRANTGAYHLYERFGFTVIGESETHITMECVSG